MKDSFETTLITPHVGRKSAKEYVKTWQMEPLTIATIAGLTPPDVGLHYFDERVEPIDFDRPTDLAAITVETYTAKRGYEIAAQYHKRGVPTLLGGYQVMLAPDEAQQYADSIYVGYAEPHWGQVLQDAQKGQLQRRYTQVGPYEFGMPRRDIFTGRPYFKLSNVETGRGCPMHCNFCSITAANNGSNVVRPIDSVIEEVTPLKDRTIFFVDDNFIGNKKHAIDLCNALEPLKMNWVGQGTLTMAKDEKLLDSLSRGGCIGMLIGFESLNPATLHEMNKDFNSKVGNYKELIKKIHSHGIGLYGTFVFGYDSEKPEDVMKTAEAAIDFGLFIAAFNHLLPFPGTPLYEQFKAEGKLSDAEWWLSPTFRFGEVPFDPKNTTAKELHELCLKARRKFYSLPSIAQRAVTNPRGNLNSPSKLAGFFAINGLLRQEVDQKDGLPLGNNPERPTPLYPASDNILI